MSVRILTGDSREVLATLPADSFHLVVTSPPYWGLRDYGVPEGIGLEDTLQEHLDALREVFRAVRRVLRPDGTLWLNYGDAYAGSWGNYAPTGTGGQREKSTERWHRRAWDDKNRRPPASAAEGFKRKDLMLLGARLAMALQEQGWWLRSEIIWCLSGGVHLYAKTPKTVGPMMLKDLVRLAPETVQLWTGERWTNVLAWTENEGRDRPLEIVFRSGERVGCTRPHLWPTQRGNVRADELEVGDVVQSASLPNEGWSPAWLTPDALWFAGLYLAEGSMSGNTIQLSGHVKEISRVQRVEAVCEHYGATMAVHEYGNRQQICIQRSAALRAVLSTVLRGRTAKDKGIAPGVWKWNQGSLRKIAEGYLEGDGSDQGNRIRLSFTRNYRLEADLRCLAARVRATLTIKPGVSSIGGKSYPSFRGEWRWKRSGHHNEKSRSEIVEIRRSRARSFWDVTVEDDTSLFALASGILTHNSKPNPMPESVEDRPSCAFEKVFLLAKSDRYYYDSHAVKTPARGTSATRGRSNYGRHTLGEAVPEKQRRDKQRRHSRRHAGFNSRWDQMTREEQMAKGANLRNVWTIATRPFPDAHFATFPPELVIPCIKAGTSEKGCCADCGAPWTRIVEKTADGKVRERKGGGLGEEHRRESLGLKPVEGIFREQVVYETKGWEPSCECPTHDAVCPQCSTVVESTNAYGESRTVGQEGLPELRRADSGSQKEEQAQRVLYPPVRESVDGGASRNHEGLDDHEQRLQDAAPQESSECLEGRLRHGASDRDGGIGRTPAHERRGCPSRQRRQARQQDRESTPDEQTTTRQSSEADVLRDMPMLQDGLPRPRECPHCRCLAKWQQRTLTPSRVLDPFGGAGTVGLVADRLGRNATLVEISPKYAEMSRQRIKDDAPLFVDVKVEEEIAEQIRMGAG